MQTFPRNGALSQEANQEQQTDFKHVQSCPVTGQLPLTSDRQAPLPVIDEEVSWGGDSSTLAAGEEGQGLPSVSTDARTETVEIEQVRS